MLDANSFSLSMEIDLHPVWIMRAGSGVRASFLNNVAEFIIKLHD